jgi:anti-anti-sigma factor
MKAIIRRNGSKALLILKGEFDTFVRDAFLEEIQRLSEQGARWIVLDMLRVKFLSSSGVTALLRARAVVRDLGGELAIARLSQDVRQTLELLGMEAVFFVASEDDTTVCAGDARAKVA